MVWFLCSVARTTHNVVFGSQLFGAMFVVCGYVCVGFGVPRHEPRIMLVLGLNCLGLCSLCVGMHLLVLVFLDTNHA